MKENKNTKVELRISAAKKETFKNFADAHNITLSEFVREACERFMEEVERK